MTNGDWEKEASRNADQIANILDNLPGLLKDGRFKDFWAEVKRASEMMSKQPITRDKRDSLRGRLNQICDAAKQQRERRDQISSEKRRLILEKVSSAELHCRSSHTFSDLNEARSLLRTATEMLKPGWNTENFLTEFANEVFGNDGRLKREDHQHCWDQIQAVYEQIGNRSRDISQTQFDHFSHLASECLSSATYGNPHEAFKELKAVQAEVKGASMTREHWQEYRNLCDLAYERATSRMSEDRAAKEEKHQEWRRKTEDFVDRMEGVMSDKQDKIDNIRQQIDRDEEIMHNAKSGDFQSQVQGWIDEKNERICKLENDISDIEAKVRDARNKLAN